MGKRPSQLQQLQALTQGLSDPALLAQQQGSMAATLAPTLARKKREEEQRQQEKEQRRQQLRQGWQPQKQGLQPGLPFQRQPQQT